MWWREKKKIWLVWGTLCVCSAAVVHNDAAWYMLTKTNRHPKSTFISSIIEVMRTKTKQENESKRNREKLSHFFFGVVAAALIYKLKAKKWTIEKRATILIELFIEFDCYSNVFFFFFISMCMCASIDEFHKFIHFQSALDWIGHTNDGALVPLFTCRFLIPCVRYTQSHSVNFQNPSRITVHRKCNTVFLSIFFSCLNPNTAEINMQIHFKSVYLSQPIKFNGLILCSTMSDIIMIHSTWTPVCVSFWTSLDLNLGARNSVFFVATILSQHFYRIHFLFISPIIYAAIIVNAPYFFVILVDLHVICGDIAWEYPTKHTVSIVTYWSWEEKKASNKCFFPFAFVFPRFLLKSCIFNICEQQQQPRHSHKLKSKWWQ